MLDLFSFEILKLILLSMCKSPVSAGLVTALAVALICNIYLVFLLWSGEQNDEYHNELTPSPVIIQPEAPINLMNSGLNLRYLKSMLNTSKLITRSRSKSLISMMNKLKRELKARGEKSENIISSSSKVIDLMF